MKSNFTIEGLNKFLTSHATIIQKSRGETLILKNWYVFTSTKMEK